MSDPLRELIPAFMVWVLLPLWVVAGAADYLLHRRSAIEHTSGRKESALHVLQAIEIGIPLLAGLFLEINQLVLIVMIVGAVLHTLTALWDTSYTAPLRYISPLEQHVHSHMEYIPLVAVSLVTLLYWDAFAGTGESATLALRLKENPLPMSHVAAVLGCVFLFQGALLGEEAWRTMTRTRRQAPAPGTRQ